VALARSLVKRPKLLLLDEPMSALDKQIRHATQIELVRLIEQLGVTCFMVTHDQEEAMTMANRVAVMTEGQIRQTGTPQEVYAYPNSRFVAGFIGSTNLFEGIISVDQPGHIMIESEDLPRAFYVDHGVSEPLGMAVSISLRPEQIRVTRVAPTQEHNWAHGMVSHLAWMGSYALYQIRLDSGKVIEASVPSQVLATSEPPGIDDEVYVSWGHDSVTVLSS
jgi:putrescine transport system ATP-binding protein